MKRKKIEEWVKTSLIDEVSVAATKITDEQIGEDEAQEAEFEDDPD